MSYRDEILTLTIDDPRYPELLKQIHKPPQQLYYRGNIEALILPHLLSVVGSRRANHYGRLAMERILPGVVRSGVSLVSGLALGVDALAHQACVQNNVPTIAVLGSGLDDKTLYPQGNKKLAHDIIRTHGVLISEYPPETKAQLYHFPLRNRIVAGLSTATLIVQAAQKSGSLITARLCLENNREVCVIPGPITDPLSTGTNELLKDGATPIIDSQDILNLLQINKQDKPAVQPTLILNEQQSLVFQHLTTQPQHVDELAAKTSLSADKLSVSLIELELAGHISNIGNMRFVKK